MQDPTWESMDTIIMDTVRKEMDNPCFEIPIKQIQIIKDSIAAFETSNGSLMNIIE